ncbi:MAG: ribosome-associated translation inhibitor RaiA [Calditrichaeota bacterium]|nr:MAG: ribosome-associated translation inhibitor RaiA [Calditrichota bacterium]
MLKKISARHFDLTDDLRATAEEEMDGLLRYFDNIISAELVLDMERHRRLAELKVSVYNQTISATGDTDDMVNSISAAFDKAKTQLKKYKGKLKQKNQEEIAGIKDAYTKPTTDVDEIE